LRIAGKLIGDGHPCFIVAEAGVNHNGKFSLAKKMVDAAKKAGADAVKFQVIDAERMITKTAEKAAYQKRNTGGGSQYEMLKRLELTGWEFRKLAAYAKRKNIVFLSSAFDEESVDLLAELKVPAFKVPSGEITNFPLLSHIAKKRKPIILSTGMSTLEEVAEALKIIKKEGAKEIALLHCVSNYPAETWEMNLRAMETLRDEFGLPVGLSDHTLGTAVPIAAAALRANIIEKHFTLNSKMPGPDHRASLEPGEFGEMVACVRDVEMALGKGIKKPTKSEEAVKKAVRKSIIANTDIKRGTEIARSMLTCKRPGDGLAPRFLDKVIGKVARTDIKKDEKIKWKKIR
jgi:N-acetylneuraminate synthase/N,N'-diacetyllegionaminate synthase